MLGASKSFRVLWIKLNYLQKHGTYSSLGGAVYAKIAYQVEHQCNTDSIKWSSVRLCEFQIQPHMKKYITISSALSPLWWSIVPSVLALLHYYFCSIRNRIEMVVPKVTILCFWNALHSLQAPTELSIIETSHISWWICPKHRRTNHPTIQLPNDLDSYQISCWSPYL